MKKLLAIVLVATFATVAVAPTFAAEKAKVDCKDAKNKNNKECKKK